MTPPEALRDTFPGMFWGYLFIWALMCLYIFTLGRRLGSLEHKLKRHELGEQKESLS
jgi:CcmD family protein